MTGRFGNSLDLAKQIKILRLPFHHPEAERLDFLEKRLFSPHTSIAMKTSIAKPSITYDRHTYRALSDPRILERFKEKIAMRYEQSLPNEDQSEQIHLGPEIVRDILSDIYRDLKNELK